MKPSNHEQSKRHTFDSFCKKILKHEARDYYDELKRQRSWKTTSNIYTHLDYSSKVSSANAILPVFPSKKSEPQVEIKSDEEMQAIE